MPLDVVHFRDFVSYYLYLIIVHHTDKIDRRIVLLKNADI